MRDRKTDKPIPAGRRLALKFISGKYQGGEFPLNEGQDVVVGRSSDLDMVLVEEMVSRRHAVFRLQSGVLTVEDLGSTNGTFVNGERIDKATLREGDRVLVGTSILRVLTVDAAPGLDEKKGVLGRETQKATRPRSNEPAEAIEPPRMSGSLEEIPLPDLMQLFSTSKKTGTLVLRAPERVARIHLDQGRIQHAELDTSPGIDARKALYRTLGFVKGHFSLDPPEARKFGEPLDMGATEFLMDGLRLQDEINALGTVPPLTATVHLSRTLPGRLRDLPPEDLDRLEIALSGPTIQAVLDASPEPDLEVMRVVMALVNKGWISTS